MLLLAQSPPNWRRYWIKEMVISIPDSNTMDKFSSVAKTFFDKIHRNQIQIRTLEKLRDTLLPKLMSGEVRVRLRQQN